MSDPNEFAIVPVPSNGPLRAAIKSDAIATGSMAAVMQQVIDSRAQRDLNLLIKRADAAMRVENAIEEQKAQEREQMIQNLCDGISRMQRRLDQHEERLALTREIDDQARKIIDTYSIPSDGIDPDPYFGEEEPEGGDYPAPNLEPGLRDATGASGELPEALKEPGTMPVPQPADLKNPQENPSSPADLDI